MWLSILAALTLGGLSDADVIIANETGLTIARIEIDDKTFEEIAAHDKILITVTPKQHDMRVVFRGGADIEWPKFNFKGVHEVFLERQNHEFKARVE